MVICKIFLHSDPEYHSSTSNTEEGTGEKQENLSDEDLRRNKEVGGIPLMIRETRLFDHAMFYQQFR